MQTQIFSDTYRSQIAHMLKSGEEVTVLDILNRVGTIDGRKYISILKRQGMRIASRWIVTPTGKNIKKHKLIQD